MPTLLTQGGFGSFAAVFRFLIGGQSAEIPAVVIANSDGVEAGTGANPGIPSSERNRAQWWNEAPSQTLAASAVFNGGSRDSGTVTGGITPYSRFGGFILASQPGTLRIEGSDDGATWYTVASQAVVAATALDVSVPARTRYHRVAFTNGATPQTSIRINSGYQS